MFFPVVVLAEGSFGDIANTFLGPVLGITELIKFICMMTGGGMVVASLVKLKDYYQNATDMRLLSILTLFVIGLAMVGLAFLPAILGSSNAT